MLPKPADCSFARLALPAVVDVAIFTEVGQNGVQGFLALLIHALILSLSAACDCDSACDVSMAVATAATVTAVAAILGLAIIAMDAEALPILLQGCRAFRRANRAVAERQTSMRTQIG